jgi:hypothetical protein
LDVKHIVLKKGAPPLNQLHMELRVSTRIPFDLQNYQYNASVDGGPTPGTLIGKAVGTPLDALNEERLLFQEGDTSIEEMLGVYEKNLLEVGAEMETNGTHHLVSEYDTLRYEYVLADEAGTVWSELVETVTAEDL